MATERLSVRRTKEILRLREQGRTVREVARSLGIEDDIASQGGGAVVGGRGSHDSDYALEWRAGEMSKRASSVLQRNVDLRKFSPAWIAIERR